MTDVDIEQLARDIELLRREHRVHDHVLERLTAALPKFGGDPGKLGQEDPWSSLGPNTQCLAVTTGGQTVPANYIRREIEMSLDTAVASGVVYGLLNPSVNGTPSASNFHFVLYANQPPFTTTYTGAIELLASTGTIHVGIVEH